MRVIVCCVAMLVSACSLAQTSGLPCMYDRYVSSLLDSDAERMLVREDRLFVLSGSGLAIYGIEKSIAPELLGTVELGHELRDGVLMGDWLIGVGGNRLVVVNVSDPATPFLDGSLDLGDDLWRVEVHGGYAYASFEDEPEIAIVSLQNIFFPMLHGSMVLQSVVSDMVLGDDTLSLFVDGVGLRVLDLGVPGAPVHIGSLDQIGFNTRLWLEGGLLYIHGSLGGVRTVDLSDASDPVQLNWAYTDHVFETLLFSDNRIFGTTGWLVRELDLSGNEGSGSVLMGRYGAMALAASGDTMYVGGTNGIQVVDIASPPRSPIVYEGDYRLERPGNAVEHGGYVYVSGMRDGFEVWDTRDPSMPELLTTVETPALDAILTINGDALYVLQRHHRPLVYDISEPTSPVLIGQLGLESTMGCRFLGVYDDLLFASEYDGYRLYDTSDPFSPVLLASLQASPGVDWADRDGDYLYLACGTNGIDVFDISDPYAPVFVLNYPVPSRLESIHAQGGIVFTEDPPTQQLSVIRIFDFSDLNDVRQITTYETGSRSRVNRVELRDDVLHVLAGFNEYQMVDISDPSDPREMGVFEGSGIFTVADDRAYLFDGFTMRVLDVSGCSPCPADLTGDGVLNFFDISAYVQVFASGGGDADWNGDGSVNFFDLSAYIQDFNAGCP